MKALLLLVSTVALAVPPPYHVGNPQCIHWLSYIGRPFHWGEPAPNIPSPVYLLWRRAKAEGTRSFVHVPASKKADLESPFVALYDEATTLQFYSIPPGLNCDEAVRSPLSAARPAQRVPSGHQFLTTTVFRSDLEGKELKPEEMWVQPSIPEERDHFRFNTYETPSESANDVQRALNFLYKDYAKQGPGRADQLQVYTAEDASAAKRTTHFVIQVNGQIVGHIQAQYSTDPAQKLNLEAHFGGLPRKAGEPYIELGRLFVAKPSELKPDTLRAIEELGGRELIRSLLYTRFFAWVNSDARAPKVVLQMNQKGRDHFKTQWNFDDDGKLVVDKPEQKEFVLAITGDNLLRTEEAVMLEYLAAAKAKARQALVKPRGGLRPKEGGPTADTVRVFLRGNELAVIDRLQSQGRLTGLRQRVDFPKEAAPPEDQVQRFQPPTAYLYLDAQK